jgi:AraC family transcriptional regulator of adaptative response/methylated-DNA-[protein]-cysteine methyltransferase
MKQEHPTTYYRIAEAIRFIQQNFQKQPSLEEIAEEMHLSPFHFQRLFSDWAGVSPKKFLQYISLEYAKGLLRNEEATLFDVAYETGLSGTGRLHDLFVKIEGMTPGEYKNGGENLLIHYHYAHCPFGKILIASTPKGICHMTFTGEEEEAFPELQQAFPNATFVQKQDAMQENALRIYQQDWSRIWPVKLHLKGTDFQLKVWEALLKIPLGKLATYGSIAKDIQNPKASRAVGTAIGSNPVAFLIPCHRVIQSSGIIGGYRWDSTRKAAIIAWEAAKINLHS